MSPLIHTITDVIVNTIASLFFVVFLLSIYLGIVWVVTKAREGW